MIQGEPLIEFARAEHATRSRDALFSRASRRTRNRGQPEGRLRAAAGRALIEAGRRLAPGLEPARVARADGPGR